MTSDRLPPHLTEKLRALAEQQNSTPEAVLTQLLETSTLAPHILQKLFNLSLDMFVITTLDSSSIEVNAAFAHNLGYSHDEIKTMNIIGLIHPDDFEASSNAMQMLSHDGALHEFENRYLHKDGSYRWFSWRAVRDGNYIYCTVRDITEQRATQDELRKTLMLYEGLVETQLDMVNRYTPDTIMTFVNKAYCEFFGKTREELIGTSFVELVPAHENAERERIYQRLEEVTQNPASRVMISKETLPDGSNRWIQWIDFGITDADGNVVEIQSVGRNITAFKLAEAELTKLNELLQTMLDHIPLMICLFDEHGNFEYVNKAWVDTLGWTVEEMREQPDMLAYFYPDPEVRQRALEHMYRNTTETVWREFETHTKHNGVVHSSWANVRLSDGRSLGIGQDIEVLLQLEEQRRYAAEIGLELEKERELMALRDQFTSMLSHEFRTPITVMMTSASLIQTYLEQLSREKITEHLSRIIEQARNMVEMLDEVLLIAKGNANKLEFNPQPEPVAQFLKALIETASFTDAMPNERLIFTADVSNMLVMPLDRRIFSHVMHNLISNALKYSPANSPVIVIANQTDKALRISVIDRGIGIPEAEQKKVFEPFYRADNAHAFKGTGLGLSIVRQGIELHGGYIELQSKAGSGSRFIITLPLPRPPQD